MGRPVPTLHPRDQRDPPSDQFYDRRVYSCADPEGHVWRFSQVLRDMSDEGMEAASGGRKVRRTL